MEGSSLSEQQSLAGLDLDSSTINSRSSSSIQTEAFTEFSILIEKICPLLNEMKGSAEATELPDFQKAMETLETDYNRVKAAVDSQNIQSSPAKQIEYLIQNLGRSLGLVLFASHEVPLSCKQNIEELCKEMMNVRFESGSDADSELSNEVETEVKTVEEIIEEETSLLCVDDVFLQIKCGTDEKFRNGLLGFYLLIKDGTVSSERIINEDIIKVLCNRFGSSKGNERVNIIRILRNLVSRDDNYKEMMKDLEFLSAIIKSLTRDLEEQREAVGLLLSLSDDPGVRKRIGKMQGCIVMLVAISNGDDLEASHDARLLLNAMSSNTQHALHMAEAGCFKPLIKYLKEGSDMSKVLMATTLSRMELTDKNSASLGEDGAIEPLVKMFNTGNLEAKLSSLNALQNLSNLKQNIQRLIDSGIVASLLQLLFSVTSVLMTLREPASAILAKVAQSEGILVKQDVTQQMLSLLNLSSPVIQNHLLEALNNIASHPNAAKVRKKMEENGAIQLLIPFLTETNIQIRTGALKLIHKLSNGVKGEFTEELGLTHITTITNIVLSSSSVCEKAFALGILSSLPLSDRKITDILKKMNLLNALVSTMSSIPAASTPSTVLLAESIAGILVRFTVPNDKRLQHYSVENGIFAALLKLLSSSSEIAKSRSVLCLAQLSQNTLNLSKSRKLKWFCIPPVDALCEVHDGFCSVKSTFCLVKAGVIGPLIQILEGSERGVDEAVLDCLLTLLQDEILVNGCNYLVKSCGVGAIIKVLEFGSLKSKEKALFILERIFRVEDHRTQYGESAQVLLIDIAQNGDPVLKPMVAQLLAQLELLQDQSSYF